MLWGGSVMPKELSRSTAPPNSGACQSSLLEDSVGDILGKARYGLGLSLAQLSRLSGIPEAQLAAWEKDRGKPDTHACYTLATLLRLHPVALETIARDRYQPTCPPYAVNRVQRYPVTNARANAYVVQIGTGKQGLVVDPGADASGIVALTRRTGVTIHGILVTHGHADHVGGVADMVALLGVPVWAHPAEYQGAGSAGVADNAIFRVGDVQVRALACPGHTAHSMSFLVDNMLFTGDALFAGSLGRATSASLYGELLASGHRLLHLPQDTPIFPGHGPATTVEQELHRNAFLVCL